MRGKGQSVHSRVTEEMNGSAASPVGMSHSPMGAQSKSADHIYLALPGFRVHKA